MAANLGRGEAIVVAHSGAGALIPSVAALAKEGLRGVIYCDAILPHPGQSWFDTAPPALGEHTHEVLKEAGFSEDEIEELIASGHARAARAPEPQTTAI